MIINQCMHIKYTIICMSNNTYKQIYIFSFIHTYTYHSSRDAKKNNLNNLRGCLHTDMLVPLHFTFSKSVYTLVYTFTCTRGLLNLKNNSNKTLKEHN